MKQFIIFTLFAVITMTIPAEPLTLAEAVDIAQLNSGTIAIANEKAVEALETAKSVRSSFFPRISGQGSYTRLNEIPAMTLPPEMGGLSIEMGTQDMYNLTLSAQQPLFMGGRILNGYKAASALANAQGMQLSAEKNNLYVDVAEAYYGVIKADAFKETAVEARVQMEEHLITLERMFGAGLLSNNDLLKAQVQLSDIQMMEIQAENAGTLSRLALNMTIGVPLNTVYEFSEEKNFTERSLPDIDESLGSAITNREDISALVEMNKAASYGLKIEKASLYPSLVAVFNYSWDNLDDSFPPEFNPSWNFTLMGSLDLFTAGERLHNIRKAEAGLNQAKTGLLLARKGVELEVRSQFAIVREKEKAAEIAGKKLEQAEEGYKVASAEFKQGLATNTDVLDASTAFAGAKTEYISALADRQIAYIKYKVTIGQKPDLNEY